MLNHLEINVSSLKLIEEELNSAIQSTAACLEAFLLDRDQHNQLESCREGIIQLAGTVKLLEIPGAIQLAEEMRALLEFMLADEKMLNDRNLSALSNAFVALPCFLDHTKARKFSLPILISPYINDLRAARCKDLAPESQFSGFRDPIDAHLPIGQEITFNENFGSLIKRLRHMYHVGLLGVIRDQDLGYKVQLLQRSMQRLYDLSQHAPIGELWKISEAVLEALSSGDLELTLNRKRLLSSIDRLIKVILNKGPEGLHQQVPPKLRTELLFLVAIAHCDGEANRLIKQHIPLEETAYSDAQLRKERDLMRGPNAATVVSIVNVLKEELNSAKEILEVAGENISGDLSGLDSLKKILTRISEILLVVGSESTGNVLKDLINKIDDWQANPEVLDKGQLLDAADTILYVESTLTRLHHLSMKEPGIDLTNGLIKQEIIAKSHLAEAEKIVVQEAQAGLSLAKRAISSFIESNFDSVHIANVAATLSTVKGGLSVLNLKRAVDILDGCISFLEVTLAQNTSASRAAELLDTLADTLIALEYYLNEIESQLDADDSILQVAEDSLAALARSSAA